MKYNYKGCKSTIIEEGREWDKRSPKEILQYAVGGLMYMPATKKGISKKIVEGDIGGITSIALCLEDAIGDSEIEEAEKSIKEILEGIQAGVIEGKLDEKDIPLIFIRVREIGQMGRLLEILGELMGMVTGFNLPKFDTKNSEGYLKEFKEVKEQVKEPLYIMPIIESKEIMDITTRVSSLVKIKEQLDKERESVLNIRVGATDFCNLYGIRRDIMTPIYDVQVVSSCLGDIVNIFGADYVCSAPVWEYFGEGEGLWLKGLREELRLDKANGFTGKTCVHPSQLPHIQDNLVVSIEEYKDAINILGMVNGVKGVEKGYNGNKMNEVKAHTKWAGKVISKAYVYGIKI